MEVIRPAVAGCLTVAMFGLLGCTAGPAPKIFNPAESCKTKQMKIPPEWRKAKKVRADDAVDVAEANQDCLVRSREVFVYNYRLAEQNRCGIVCETKKITPWALLTFVLGLLVGM